MLPRVPLHSQRLTSHYWGCNISYLNLEGLHKVWQELDEAPLRAQKLDEASDPIGNDGWKPN